MIIDTLENLKNYASVNPLFPKVIEWLENNDLETVEPGKISSSTSRWLRVRLPMRLSLRHTTR